jgi:CheY-like chemotaxis protein
MEQIDPRILIVVVDDDVLERMGASYMFSDAGYRVLEAENADEALELFENNDDIRVLFTDVSMPGTMSGSDLARRVAEKWPAVGIILASGRARPGELAMRMRFHDTPYDPMAVLRQAKEMTIPLA